MAISQSARALSDDNNFHKIASYRRERAKDETFNNNPLRVVEERKRGDESITKSTKS
jgi:hypothetical protein